MPEQIRTDRAVRQARCRSGSLLRSPVQFLEAINLLASVQALKRNIAGQLQIKEGQRILDVGCGIGDAVQTLALLVGDTGRVVGLDNSALMIEEARKRTDGVSLPVDFRVGDAQQLTFADQTFDGCRADRVFMYLDDPRRALTEMIRVARSGGLDCGLRCRLGWSDGQSSGSWPDTQDDPGGVRERTSRLDGALIACALSDKRTQRCHCDSAYDLARSCVLHPHLSWSLEWGAGRRHPFDQRSYRVVGCPRAGQSRRSVFCGSPGLYREWTKAVEI